MIRVRGLCHSYSLSGIRSLVDVCVDVERGERIALIGANASGKTTFGRCLNGLLRPDSGSVQVDGFSTADAGSVAEVRRRVAMVFQNPDDQLVATSVAAEIAFGLENLGVETAPMRERVREVLERFDLERYQRRPPHQLSGGEKQRLAIASSFAVGPSYLVLDEPTSMLDSSARADLLELIGEMSQLEQIATIHITQNVEEACQADRILVMARGELVMDGSPAHVFGRAPELRELGLHPPFAYELASSTGLTGPATAAGPSATALVPHLTELCSKLPKPRRFSPHATGDAGTSLRVEDLHYAYAGTEGSVPALMGVSGDLSSGGAVGIIGASGSGKSTLAQHLNGLLEPQRGAVVLDGVAIAAFDDLTAVRRRVGLVFQFPEVQLFEETVAADVAFGPRNFGCSEAEIRSRVRESLEAVALPVDEFGARPPLSLSGGERRRAAIAGVLAMNPEVLVLDEPSAGLDPRGRDRLRDMLSALRDQGMRVVLITHDAELVAAATARVLALTRGEVVASGPTHSVLGALDFAAVTGLEPPSVARLVHLLRRAGCPLPPEVISSRQLLEYFTPISQPIGGDSV